MTPMMAHAVRSAWPLLCVFFPEGPRKGQGMMAATHANLGSITERRPQTTDARSSDRICSQTDRQTDRQTDK